MKFKKLRISIIIIALLLVAGNLFVGNPIIHMNNLKLKQSITSIMTDSVELNKIVPFEWDVVYTFDPYASKSQIEEIIGFKSNLIRENSVNEGMVHLLFVKDEKVVASILGYSENLGYSMDFIDRVRYSDNYIFNIDKINDVVILFIAK